MKRRPTTKDWVENTREYIKRTITKNFKRIQAAINGDLITQGAAGRKFVDKLEAKLAKYCEKKRLEPIVFTVRLKREIAKDCCDLYREIKMDSAEVNLLKTLFAKVMPDLRQIEIHQKSEVNHVVHIPLRPASTEEWVKQVKKLEAEREAEEIKSAKNVIPIDHVGAVD